MDILFGSLIFRVTEDGKLRLVKAHHLDAANRKPRADLFPVEVERAGGTTSGCINMHGAGETQQMHYVRHAIDGNVLTLVQRSDALEVTGVYTMYDDTNAVRVVQKVRNISEQEQCLETAGSLTLHFGEAVSDSRDWIFHRYTNHRYSEVAPEVHSLYDMGFYWVNTSWRTINMGNHSTIEYIPMGVLENKADGMCMMFQIESYFDWYYEMGVDRDMYYLHLSGPNAHYHQWNRVLAPGEEYTTIPVAICASSSLNGVMGEMTRYRRHIKPVSAPDAHLPAIFNEYMHLSWDNPWAHKTAEIAPAIARTGCEYYVIDCGWHDEVSSDIIYRHFGTWYESKMRFPDGLRKTADLVHSLGMKFGLWIAPEVVGRDNKKMIEYYGDECFITHNGKKTGNSTGYLLDYRHPKVIDYMTRAFDRMVNEYGVDYIKYDGCSSAGAGPERDCTSPGAGLEDHTNAFLNWTKAMMLRHPNVIFEDCAGGGQRLDYSALSIFSLCSTSDQTDYKKYPYIVGNILCAVLPEQAAVWSYPVATSLDSYDARENADEEIGEELVAMNMVNALLGRIHLASRVDLLSEKKQALIREGVDVYNVMTPEKLESVPYMPLGYARFGDTLVSVGIMTEKKLYLGVWNLHGERHVEIPLPGINPAAAQVAYPLSLPTSFGLSGNTLTIDFTEDEQARLFAIDLQ